MTAPGGVGAARGDAPTPQDAAADWLDAIQAAEIKAGLDWTLENAHPLLMSVGPLTAALRQVSALHQPTEWFYFGGPRDHCSQCSGPWPCPTARVLAAAAARPVPVAADVPTPSAATKNGEAQR